MTLPATRDEANEAEALARKRLAEFRDAGAFRRDAGHVLLRGEMKTFALHSVFNLATLKDYAARGWDDARLALDELAASILGSGEKLPPQLADHVINRLHPSLPRPRGPKKATNILRDICFVAVISEVSERFNLRPTRNRASRAPAHRPSACSVVANAIQLELPDAAARAHERALEQVWERLAPWVFQQEEKLLAMARRT